MLPYALPQRDRPLIFLHVNPLIGVFNGDIDVGG